MTKLRTEEWMANVPAGLKLLPRWCGWRGSKKPLDLRTGLPARVNTPQRLGTFKEAVQFYREHERDPNAGVGFVFTKGDRLIFLDLDHCLVSQSTPAPWATDLASFLGASTYTEVSPSGTGLHAFVLGELERPSGTSGARVEVGGGGAVEVYAERRFSTVTGRRWGTAKLGEVPGLVDALPEALQAKLRRGEVGEAPLATREPLSRRHEVWEALQHISPDVSNDEWVRVGMALKSAFGDDGLPLWDKWSSRGQKYHRGEPAQRWRSFRRAGVGLGSLFRMARERGWAPPEQGPAEAFADYARTSVFWTIPASEVQDEVLEWLCRPLGLAKGYASMVAGDPGRGKSLMTIDMAARLSRGLAFPWESGRVERVPRRVFYLNAEDGQGDTVKPRLRAAGADLSRVEVLDIAGGSQIPQLPDDVEELEHMLLDLPDTDLVVIDPLNAFLGRDVDAHKAHDIRQALQPLSDMLKRTRRTVEFVAHLNKNEAMSALYRVSGSADQIAFVRSGLLVGVDPEADDDEWRIVAPLKWNLGKPPPSRSFRIVDAGREIGRLEWGEESEATAEDVVRRERGSDKVSRVKEAAEWIKSRLAASAVSSREMEADALAAGISRATLNRAAASIGVRRERDLITGGWRWPKVPTFVEEEKDETESEAEAHGPQGPGGTGGVRRWPTGPARLRDHHRS